MDTNNKSDITLDKAIEILEHRGEYERSIQNYEARYEWKAEKGGRI